MKNTLLILMGLVFLPLLAAAQADSTELAASEAPDVQLIVRKSGDDVLLRWAATTPGVWFHALGGYVRIERTAFDAFQNMAAAPTDTLVRELRPWTVAELEAAMQQYPNNNYLPMAGQSIHGEWETLQPAQQLDMATILARREELNHRYSTALFIADMDTQAAAAMGLFYQDTNVPKAQYLIYRLTIVGAQGQIYTATALYNPNFDLTATPNIDDAAAADGYVRLTWDRSSHERYFTAYYIERSADNARFERLNKHPYVNAVDEKQAFGIPPITYLADAENDKPYYYRIVGIDAFGQESEPSASVLLTAKDQVPPAAPIRPEAGMVGGTTMMIQWEQDQTSDDMAAYIIKRSRAFDGSYQPISGRLPIHTRQFEDTAPDAVSDNYYRICAIDRSGNEACSPPAYGFLNDRTPPPPPQGLAGNIDTLGVVRLRWPLGTTPDIGGYNVYAANGPNEVFIRRNAQVVRDTAWQDTVLLNTLTEEMYYRITAVDLRSNVSGMSEVLRLEKPDTIAPAAAVFEGYEVRETGVYLRWANSNSRDVQHHELRRQQPDGTWQVLATLTGNEVEWEDTTVQPGTTYAYQIRAVDDAANASADVRTLCIAVPQRVAKVLPALGLGTAGEQVQLAFDWPATAAAVQKVVIYKSVNDSPFQPLQILTEGFVLQWSDAQCSPGNVYAYKYRVFYANGLKSDYSPVGVVRL